MSRADDEARKAKKRAARARRRAEKKRLAERGSLPRYGSPALTSGSEPPADQADPSIVSMEDWISQVQDMLDIPTQSGTGEDWWFGFSMAMLREECPEPPIAAERIVAIMNDLGLPFSSQVLLRNGILALGPVKTQFTE